MCECKQYCGKIHKLIQNFPRFCEPESVLPLDGLYFFFEEGEKAVHEKYASDRIVRVGNHLTNHGLMNRLKKHYTGSKRNSAFLRIVGGSLIRRDNPEAECLNSDPGMGHWERKNVKYRKYCKPYKVYSKNYIRENTKFTAISVPDKEIRSQLEKALVSTISLCEQCHPSENWLGQFAYCQLTRQSGLWQINYLYKKDLVMTPFIMKKFEDSVNNTKNHYLSVMSNLSNM